MFLRKKITNKEKQLSLLYEKLFALEKATIIEHQADAIFGLDKKIEETKNSLQEVQNQLEELTQKKDTRDSRPKQVLQEDNHHCYTKHGLSRARLGDLAIISGACLVSLLFIKDTFWLLAISLVLLLTETFSIKHIGLASIPSWLLKMSLILAYLSLFYNSFFKIKFEDRVGYFLGRDMVLYTPDNQDSLISMDLAIGIIAVLCWLTAALLLKVLFVEILNILELRRGGDKGAV